jgi:type II secretory pathway pseudopilin PulG
MPASFSYAPHSCLRKQRGAALMLMLVIIIIGSAAFLVSALSGAGLKIERAKITANSLAQAKDALIGFSTSVDLSGSRPGDLPCPDMNNDGIAETSCGNAAGSTFQNYRLGRLPWKTLGLPDLRDGSGERLWYAVSNNFKYNTRTTCSSSGQPGCLNSDTVGTITIRNSAGTIINDANLGNGVAAVIIAPGDVLQRQGAASPQRRSCTIGLNCDALETCTTTPPTLTPKCDPANYLDNVSAEDNADFTDSATNGFIQGIVKDSSDRIILNDQLLVITQDNIMQAIQKRVTGEVKNCLNEYANPVNGGAGRYPWPAKLDPLTAVSYSDSSNTLFGRIPDTTFTATDSDSGGIMGNTWVGNCKIISNSGWWLNWKDIVFYGLADGYKPKNPPSSPSCGTCIAVNPPSPNTDKKFIVILSGKKLTGQSRSTNTERGTLTNFLEYGNAGGVTPFEQRPNSPTFNDTVVFQ